MLLAVVAVLAIGGVAMAANLGLLDGSDRSLQLVDATTGAAGELGAPLVTALPSEDGSQQAFVIDGIGMVQILRSTDGDRLALSVSDVSTQPGWAVDTTPIGGAAVRVEFRSARRTMDFEAFLSDDGEIAARFRIQPRGRPLVVEADGAVPSSRSAPAPSEGAAGGSAVAPPAGAAPSTTDPPAAGPDVARPDADHPPAGSADNGAERSAPSTRVTPPAARSKPPGLSVEEGTWIYYQDGVYMLDNTVRGDRSAPPQRGVAGNDLGPQDAVDGRPGGDR